MTPKEECEVLMREMISFAKLMLSEHAEFSPFGGFLRPNRQVTHLSALIKDTEYGEPKELIRILHQRLRNELKSGNLTASAVVYNVGNIRDPRSEKIVDAIQICLEHIENYSVEILIPYDIDSAAEPLYGTLFAQKGEPKIFI